MKQRHIDRNIDLRNPWAPTVRTYLPWAVVGLALVYVGASMATPSDAAGEMKIHEAGNLPIVDGGRTKPIDTMARINLMLISRRQYFVDADGKSQPAIRWLLDTISGQGDDHKVFYIENDQVRDLMGLAGRSGYRYSYAELRPKLEDLEKQDERANSLSQSRDQIDLFDAKVVELGRRVRLYVQMRDLLEYRMFEKVMNNQPALAKFIDFLKQSRTKTPHLALMANGQWQTFMIAYVLAQAGGQPNPSVEAWVGLRTAYAQGDVYNFNRTVDVYQNYLDGQLPGEHGKAGFEVFYYHFAPFSKCVILYVFAGLLAAVSWVLLPTAGRAWMDAMNRSAFWLLAFTLLIHSIGMISRMVISGRLPPVTNLYSSAVFIGWAAVGLGLVLERIFRIGIGNVVAAVVGFLTCYLANILAESGDTIEMLQAVLDTNFWLGTHVVCVTLGYMATIVAGFVGITFILLGLFTPLLTREWYKIFGQIIYGILCFATFLSFTGTVLGGIWADQSWGRFWGWDPKENGALLIVIWNALIIHARWAGMVKTRGMAVLAIFGNMITAWSWFGTNQLGVGLHAYGFSKDLAEGCRWFWMSQLALLGMGLVPTNKWRSFGRESAAPPKPDKKMPRDSKDEGGNGQPAPKGQVDTAIKVQPAGA